MNLKPLLDLSEEPPNQDDKDKAWWETGNKRRGSTSRPRKAEAFDGEYDETTPTRFMSCCAPQPSASGFSTAFNVATSPSDAQSSNALSARHAGAADPLTARQISYPRQHQVGHDRHVPLQRRSLEGNTPIAPPA